MPFDQIYWQGGGMQFVAKDYTQVSAATDVRFGKTETEDSQSKFAFIGNRRLSLQDWQQLYIRDKRWPYMYFHSEEEDALRQNGPKPNFDDSSWKEDTGDFVAYQRSKIVYGWPGARTYASYKVNDMAKTGNNGNNIVDVYGDNPTDDDLFQAQNRESCHHYTTVANSKDYDNTFCGIHIDYPLKITANKNYNGFYLLLKRKRFHYNESNIKISIPNLEENGALNKFQSFTGLVPTYFDKNGNYLPNNSFAPQDWRNLSIKDRVSSNTGPIGDWLSYAVPASSDWSNYGSQVLPSVLKLAARKMPNLRDAPCEVDWKGGDGGIWIDVNQRWGSENILGNIQNILGYRRLTNNNPDPDRKRQSVKESSVYQNCYNTDTAIWAIRSGLDFLDATTRAALNLPANDSQVTEGVVLSDAFRTVIPSLRAQTGGDKASQKTTLRSFAFYGDVVNNVFGTTLAHVVDVEHFSGTNFSGKNPTNQQGWWFQYWAGWRMPNATYTRFGFGDETFGVTVPNEWLRHYPAFGQLWELPVEGVDQFGTTLRYGLVAPVPNSIRLDETTTFWLFSSKVGEDEIWNLLPQSRKNQFPQGTGDTDASGNPVTKRSLMRGDWFYCNGLSIAPLDILDNTGLLGSGPGPGIWRWKVVDSGGKYQGIGGTEDGQLPSNHPLGPGKTNVEYGVYFDLEEAGERFGNWDEKKVIDAVIDPEYSVRKQVKTGSVYLKNITIKINDIVQKAQDDVLGEYQLLSNNEIYSNVGKITATGSKGSKVVTFTKMYKNKTNIISRYIDASFKILFGSDEYSIASVSSSGNSITLSSSLKTALSSSDFTLKIPRGSRNENYTWGEYKLENFDSTEYDPVECEWIALNAFGGVDFVNGVTDQPLRGTLVPNLMATNSDFLKSALFGSMWWEIFMDVYSNPSTWPDNPPDKGKDNNWQNSFHKVSMQKEFGLFGNLSGFKESDIKMPVRHPFFANELSEGLHNLQDFDMVAYWNNIYITVSNGNFGHVSAQLENPRINPTWKGCGYLEYYEYEHTGAGVEDKDGNKVSSIADGLTITQITEKTGFSNVKSTVLTPRIGYGKGRTTFAHGQDLSVFNISQFWYGGIDKASSVIWPNYKYNTAQLGDINVTVDSEYTGGNATNFSEWGEEFAEAYPGESSVKIADGPWFAFCGFKKPPNIIQWLAENSALKLSLPRTAQHLSDFASHDITIGNEFTDASMNLKLTHWNNMWKVKMENHLKHPYVLAQYGWGGDMLGWGEYDADTRFHVFTIFDSDQVLTTGSTIEVSLEQCPPPFELELGDQFGIGIEEDAQLLGYGRGMKPLDNYQLVLIAK